MGVNSGLRAMQLQGEKSAGENTDWLEARGAAPLDTDLVSGPWDNPTATGMVLHIKVGTLTGTPTYKPSLIGYDIDNNTYIIWTATSAIAAAGDKFYWLGPGASTVGAYTEGAGVPVPRNYAIFVDYTGTPATDYADVTVNVQLLR